MTDEERAKRICDTMAQRFPIFKNKLFRSDVEKEIFLGLVALRKEIEDEQEPENPFKRYEL